MKQENRTEKYEQKNRKKYVYIWMVGLKGWKNPYTMAKENQIKWEGY